MEISELQISQVNKQIEALIKAESFMERSWRKQELQEFRHRRILRSFHFRKKT